MKVLPFSEGNFATALSNKYTPPTIVKDKNHFKFFYNYLGKKGLSAQTIVVEEDYISKDFLTDYASYYVLCFESYPKYCKRLHFFSEELSREKIEDFITTPEDSSAKIKESYLGFIVVKPIPVTVIGYTVLKTFPGNKSFGNRNFWGIRDYKAHFYGVEIPVKSLAFQEQDSVLAACATTAIWSMLNKASVDYHTVLKSPSSITKDADVVSPDGSRLFPNAGLDLLQICKAIYNSGLVSEVKQPDIELRKQSGEVELRVVSVSYLKKILNYGFWTGLLTQNSKWKGGL